MKVVTSLSIVIIACTFGSYAYGGITGEELVTKWQKEYRQTISLKMKNLELNADYPVNIDRPFIINGFDLNNTAYKLEVKTRTQGVEIFLSELKLYRGKHVESVSIVIEKGKPGEISSTSQNSPAEAMTFKTEINDSSTKNN